MSSPYYIYARTLERQTTHSKKAKKEEMKCLILHLLAFSLTVKKRATDCYFPWCSSDTVNFLRPLARREANTRRPFLVAILSRKPCLFTLLLLCGWNVLFILFYRFYVIIPRFWVAKVHIYFQTTKSYTIFSTNFYVFFKKKRNFAPEKEDFHIKSR